MAALTEMSDKPDAGSLQLLRRIDAKLEDAIDSLDRFDRWRRIPDPRPLVSSGKAEATMVTLELEAEILAALQDMARQNTVTVEQQAKMLLEQMLRQARSGEHRAELARRIASMTPKGVGQTDSTELLREDRLR
jgi:hypothetical protein